MARAFRLNSTRALLAGSAVLLGAATAAMAQQAADQQSPPVNSSQSLNLPENPQLFGTTMPSVIKATAIVNGDVITQTDVDQRLQFLSIANGQPIPAEQVEALRQQVLRNLIDETLQIQAAKAEKIEIKKSDIDRTVERVAADSKQTPQQLAAYLDAHGSSISSLRRQIEGEIAWRRLQQAKIEAGVSVGDDEVKAVLDRLNAAKGTEEYRVGEIFLSATPYTEEQTLQNAQKILEQLKNGASFAAYARQYSEASTAAVGGDLGWVRPEQLPTALSAVLKQMGPGTISKPIEVNGGVSIIAVQDTRKVLTPDPRDAILSLKQVSINFPKGTSRQQAEPIVASFAEAAKNIGGCGGAEKIAGEFHGEVVTSDQIKLRDLPATLQQMMLPMQVGQATQPFGSLDEGVRVLVICGRDEAQSNAPTYDDVYSQLNEERVNSRARRYLADLRRDAIIEFR
ncbi:peptidylprolyl isomerase [Sphingomonas segetis]|uniref:peptidylprolyl isomerase n=1 Tax=Sphingomonas segetis TaxID=1104779 RepID=UPI001E3A765E|nr:peptidylprolyl isomerase [Sphingomonas segetis]